MIGSEVARRSEAELHGDAVFLPMLWLGASHHHLAFPGTVSVGAETYVRVIMDVLQSLITGGFRRIVFLNAHSGNATPVRLAMNEVEIAHRKELPDLWIAMANWFDLVTPPSHWKQTKIIHACEWETSAIQAIRPELVKEDAMVATRCENLSQYYSPDYSTPSRVEIARSIEQSSSSGAFGYPEDATLEKGEELLQAATREFVAFVREYSKY
jgi:creatinine amidohydrolase